MVNNEQFLTAIFGDNAPFAHVTSFLTDPNQTDRSDWFGGYAKDVGIIPDSNQYFTISIFNPDEHGKARRRKVLYLATYCIVLDDVREKLPIELVTLLGQPSWVLETSPGSEQWGFILQYPCQDRTKVENLLDGLVDKGVAPDGKDPGMKGVTRYVRLPCGVNTKASKRLPDGTFPPSVMKEWHPEHKVTLEALAAVFDINLDAARRDSRVDGAANVPDHPVLNSVTVKETLSDGRYDITCPWVDEHTGQADDGAALFTNEDGTFGFKCHHGSCQHRTGRDLIQQLGIKSIVDDWQIKRTFSKFIEEPEIDFIGKPDYQKGVDILLTMDKKSPATVKYAEELITFYNTLSPGLRNLYTMQVKEYMGFRVSDIKEIIRESTVRRAGEYEDFVYIVENDVIHNLRKRSFCKVRAFYDDHISTDPFVREVFENDRIVKADRLTYLPGQPRFLQDVDGARLINSWGGVLGMGKEGDITPWWDHFDTLGWGEHRKHIEQFMAFTILFPELKINHALILGGGEGVGKDMLLEPLKVAMGREFDTINGKKLLSAYNGYLMDKKYLHINEVEMGNRKDAKDVYNNIKDLVTAPPYTHKVSMKYLNDVDIPNIVNVTMTTNSPIPLATGEDSRRFYPVWTDLKVRGNQEMLQHFRRTWDWLRAEGNDAVIWHLRHEVDLSDFSHDVAPAMTNHMKDMNDMTLDPVIGILKEMIERRLGCFVSDIVSNRDIQSILKVRSLYDLEYEYDYPISSQLASRKMMEAGLGNRADLFDGEKSRGWIIRNDVKYRTLGMAALGAERARQMEQKEPLIKVVK